jgi:hypothetical protein
LIVLAFGICSSIAALQGQSDPTCLQSYKVRAACPEWDVRLCCALQVPSAVGVTTQAAVQVAQAAQAVSQQAASLHAAAEVHAAKAHAATSQVQSLQATAQVRVEGLALVVGKGRRGVLPLTGM